LKNNGHKLFELILKITVLEIADLIALYAVNSCLTYNFLDGSLMSFCICVGNVDEYHKVNKSVKEHMSKLIKLQKVRK